MSELDPDDAATVAALFLPDQPVGPPIPAFDGVMAEALFWADMASPDELKAYALAGYTRMPAKDQAGFLSYVGGRNDG